MKHLILALMTITPLSACSACDGYEWEMQNQYKQFPDYKYVEIDCITYNMRNIIQRLGSVDAQDRDYHDALIHQLDQEIIMIRYLLEIE